MKTLLIGLFLAAMLLFIGCSDDNCPTCPETQAPTYPAYPIVGYWDAVQCEGMLLNDGSLTHNVTFRRDGTFTEYDCASSAKVVTGTYFLDGERLALVPDDETAPTAVWHCVVNADDMTWCRCEKDNTPAWLYVRSTAD